MRSFDMLIFLKDYSLIGKHRHRRGVNMIFVKSKNKLQDEHEKLNMLFLNIK